jgi:hypothetical protein
MTMNKMLAMKKHQAIAHKLSIMDDRMRDNVMHYGIFCMMLNATVMKSHTWIAAMDKSIPSNESTDSVQSEHTVKR